MSSDEFSMINSMVKKDSRVVLFTKSGCTITTKWDTLVYTDHYIVCRALFSDAKVFIPLDSLEFFQVNID